MLWSLLLLVGCNRGVQVELALDEADTADITYSYKRTGLFVVNGFTPTFEATGKRELTVERPGRLHEHPLEVSETFVERVVKAEQETDMLEWRSVSGEPEPTQLAAAMVWFPSEPVKTELVAGARGLRTPTATRATWGDGEADLGFVLQPLLHAPSERVKVGDSWSVSLEPLPEIGLDHHWHREWTVTDIDGSIATIEEVNRMGGPEGAIPEDTKERRSKTRFDTATGKPVDYRMRDLRNPFLAVDVELTWDWE